MGCGCKKNRNVQPQNTPLPVEVQINFSEETTSTELGPVTEEQSALINEIANKLREINSSEEPQ
jgi:hypothetical protein